MLTDLHLSLDDGPLVLDRIHILAIRMSYHELLTEVWNLQPVDDVLCFVKCFHVCRAANVPHSDAAVSSVS